MKYFAPLYSNINFYSSNSDLASLNTDTLTDGYEAYSIGAVTSMFKLFKDRAYVFGGYASSPQAVFIAPNGKDIWVCEDPYHLPSLNSYQQKFCQYNPFISFPNYSYAPTKPTTQYPTVYWIDPAILPYYPPSPLFNPGVAATYARGQVSLNLTDETIFVLWDSRILSTSILHLTFASTNAPNVHQKKIVMENNKATITFVSPPGNAVMNFLIVNNILSIS